MASGKRSKRLERLGVMPRSKATVLEQTMESDKKRLTLDLEVAVHRRLKVVSALKGVSMREYCQAAIRARLEKDESRDHDTIGASEI